MEHAHSADDMDVQMLRGLVAEPRQVIAERDIQIAQQVAAITRNVRTITGREARISVLTGEVARLRRAQFDAHSEKMDPAQRVLFDETMAAKIAAVEAELDALQSPPAEAPTNGPRQAPKRRPLPEDLERIETRHEPASSCCGQCGGDLVRVGDHASEKLSCKPLPFYVRPDVYAAHGWASVA